MVLETVPFAEFWCHKGFRKPNIPVLCGDGVHLGRICQSAIKAKDLLEFQLDIVLSNVDKATYWKSPNMRITLEKKNKAFSTMMERRKTTFVGKSSKSSMNVTNGVNKMTSSRYDVGAACKHTT